MSLTNVLVALNVLAFVYEVAAGGLDANTGVRDRAIEAGVLYGPAVVAGHQWYRIVTAAFLHGSVPHVLLNMVALYQVGNLVEKLMGTARFAVVYAAALVCSGLAVLWFNFDSATLGASGAIFGLFGALVAIGLSLPPRGMNLVTQTLPIIGINLAFGFAVPGISNAAHIGGLVSGFLVGYAVFAVPSARRTAVNAQINGLVPVAQAVAQAPEAAERAAQTEDAFHSDAGAGLPFEGDDPAPRAHEPR